MGVNARISNNAVSTLALSASDTDTTITVASGDGSDFPQISGSQWFPVTVIKASAPDQFEVMKCTGISGDALTVVRGQENTLALSFDPGDIVSHRLTAAVFDDVVSNVATLESGKEDKSALKSAAYTESSDYATAAQGAKADSAVQNVKTVDGEAVEGTGNIVIVTQGNGVFNNNNDSTGAYGDNYCFYRKVGNWIDLQMAFDVTADWAGDGDDPPSGSGNPIASFIITNLGNIDTSAANLSIPGSPVIHTDSSYTELLVPRIDNYGSNKIGIFFYLNGEYFSSKQEHPKAAWGRTRFCASFKTQ